MKPFELVAGAVALAGCLVAGCSTPANLVVAGDFQGLVDGNVGIVRGTGEAWIEDKATGLVVLGPLLLQDQAFYAFRLRPAESVDLLESQVPPWAGDQLVRWARRFQPTEPE